MRSTLEPLGYGDAKIQEVDDPELGDNVVQVAVAQLDPAEVTEVEQALDDDFGVAGDEFSAQSIGPTFGEQIARTAGLAVFASLLLISLYIGFRFEFKFAVPVLIALAHDLLITAGVYALTDREVTTSTVAALLTIMGYSLYDTVIVFDRIRENVPRMPRATYSQIANRSMSEVFTRSLATSFVVLMPVGSLLLFGGETLKDFAFALLVGVASGAYSSIFIATPVLVEWKEREPTYMRRRRMIRQQLAERCRHSRPGRSRSPRPAAAAAGTATAPAVAATAAPAASRRAHAASARPGGRPRPARPRPPRPHPARRSAHAGAAVGVHAAPTAARRPRRRRPPPSASTPPPTPPPARPDPEPPPAATQPPPAATPDGADGSDGADGAAKGKAAESRVSSTSGPGTPKSSKRQRRGRKKHGRR